MNECQKQNGSAKKKVETYNIDIICANLKNNKTQKWYLILFKYAMYIEKYKNTYGKDFSTSGKWLSLGEEGAGGECCQKSATWCLLKQKAAE